jgi:hypothetical protein
MLVELANALNKKHQIYLDGRTITLRSIGEKDVVAVEALISNEDKSFYYPIQGMIRNPREQELDEQEALLFLLDYIDLYLEDYFESSEDLLIPIDWTEYQYDAVDFFLRAQILNQKLEDSANTILGIEGYEESQENH